MASPSAPRRVAYVVFAILLLLTSVLVLLPGLVNKTPQELFLISVSCSKEA